MSVKEWFVGLYNGVCKNAPSILSGTGIGLMLTGTVLAVKATPKALECIEEKKQNEGHEHLTFMQMAEATWRCYIWALLAETAGASCVIASTVESNKRNAALAMAANAAETGLRELREYRRFVAEQLGDKKEAEIHSQAMQKMVEQNPPPAGFADKAVIDGVAPKPICYDESFGRYYYVDYDTVAAAVNKLNHQINTNPCGYVSLNDFYTEIGVPIMKEGNRLGWNQDIGLIEIPEKEFVTYAGTPSGWPCWVLEFVNPPRYEYNYFR